MKIIFPYKNGLSETDTDLIKVDKHKVQHWHMYACGYPYKYFKRK